MIQWAKDVWEGFWTVLVGMKITWRHMFTQKVTLNYPEEKWQLPPKSRMRLFMAYEDCIGCGQCARACPVQCIYIKADKRDPKATPIFAANGQPIKLDVTVFDIDMSLCCYCNLCTYPCPTNCIYMTPEYEFASTDLTNHLYHFAKPNAKFLTVKPAPKVAPAPAAPKAAAPAGGAPRTGGPGRWCASGSGGSQRIRASGAGGSLTQVGAEAVIFYVFATLTIGAAAVVVLARSLIYSAFALLFTFFGVAALYVLLGADFLAATQLLIYVGGILVLLLFGVMLTHKLYDLDLKSEVTQFLPGLIVSAGIFGLLALTATRTRWAVGGGRLPAATTQEIGRLFMGSYLLPFEAASVLLLVALMGAAMIVRRRKDA